MVSPIFPAGLKIAGLRKTYRTAGTEQDVLAGLDLLVEPGEIVTLIGTSGTGKTTLLRCIAGLEKYDAGTISLNGRPLEAGDVSYVFQKPILYPHLSIKDNILFGTRLKSFAGQADLAHFRLLLKLLKLEGLENRRPSQLSGGQAQRVGIARALMRKSLLVLFDEPLSSVDEEMSASIRRDLLALHQELRFTALFITHDQNEALQLGNRVAVLTGGRLAQCSSPSELLQNPRQVEVALLTGSPGFNLLKAKENGVSARDLNFGFRATSVSLEPVKGQILQVEISGMRPLTSGLLYSARLLETQQLVADCGVTVVLGEGQNLDFVTALGQHLEIGKLQTLHLAQTDCFIFDQASGRRLTR